MVRRNDEPAGRPRVRRARGKVADHALLRSIVDRPCDERGVARRLAHERDARAEAEVAERRAAFLAEASRLLAAAFDGPATLATLAELAVPHVSDWCVFELLRDDGTLDPVGIAHHDPARAELARDARKRFPPRPGDAFGVARVVRERTPVLAPRVTDAMLRESVDDPALLAVLRELGIGSTMVVPMVARGRTLGALVLVREDAARPYGQADLDFAEDFASRAAIAIDNARLLEETRDAVRVRDEFLSIASHELKTPLTSMHLQVQMLLLAVRRGQHERLAPERLGPTLESVSRQTTRLAGLVNDLLDVSRIAAGRLEVQRDELDLSSVARDVCSRFAHELAAAGCELRLCAPAPVQGRWDKLRIEQVLTNLLSNAIKYGRGRPIDVEVRADGARHAALVVRDQGIGIEPDQAARIFDRFERAVSSRNYGGLGLGLYITRQIVDAHGGAIRVESRPGEGSTFFVELPCD